MSDDDTTNYDAWSSFVARVVAECRERRHFLGRAEERGLKDQAGEDWRAGDEMVDSINRIVGLARDRALATLQSWRQPIGDLPTQVGAAIAALESLPDMRDHYCSIGLIYVIHRLGKG